MASAAAPGTYSLVQLAYNTISCSRRPSRSSVSAGAARHLAPGGAFVIELEVPRLRELPPGRRASVWQHDPGYVGVDGYDVAHQRPVSHHFTFDGSGQARLFRGPHRYIRPAELDPIAQLAGFELETRHADRTGREFTAESGSHVSVYRLPVKS